MKKLLKNLFGMLLFGLIFIPSFNIKAATSVIDIYSSNKNPAVGSYITVTAYVKSSENFGSYQYILTYDSSKLKMTGSTASSGGASAVEVFPATKSTSLKFTFKVIAAGTSTISAKNREIAFWNEKEGVPTVSGVTIKSYIKVNTPIVYSTNNYLKNLTIDNQTLSPTFNKETTNYTVSLDSDITSIKITAPVEDATAKVTGAGTINVEEGENKLNIVVTSEKGTTRTYTILATVIDKNPINITIDKKKYTVIKRLTTLEMPKTCTNDTIEMNGFKVPVYNCETTNFTLIGLKDELGNNNLYIYDKDKNTYILYNELSFQTITINIMEPKEVIKNYQRTSIKLNDKEITAYKINNKSKYALLYGINIETGKTSWYLYEETENTIQIYNQEEINLYKKKKEDADIIIYSFAGAIVLLSTLLIIIAVKKNKPIKKDKDKIKEEFIKEDKEIKDKIKKEKKKIKEVIEETKEEISEIKDTIKVDKKDDLIEKEQKEEFEIDKDIKSLKKKKKKDIFEDW